jgi:FkbM family methyltransferase
MKQMIRLRPFLRLARRAVDSLLSPVGLATAGKEQISQFSRLSLYDVLARIHDLGVAPKSVIDIGAAYGDWSVACHSIFPSAKYFLVEPLEEFAEFLSSRVRELNSATYVPAAAVAENGTHAIHVHQDLVGSSLLLETEGGDVNGTARVVRSITVDELVRDHKAPGPYLLKVDVQGAELDVLAGASNTLEYTDLVILEVSFFRFFLEGPQFHDVVEFMREAGFVVYDIFGLTYRLLDGALAQADVVFVPDKSPLRSQHIYASPEQRYEQNVALRAVYSRHWD